MIDDLVSRSRMRVAGACAVAVLALAAAPAALAWEPSKPVEFVVPAGTGGGADQMARLIQGIIVKHKLMKESLVVVNKSGGAGAEGFLDVKDAKGDPHKIIITLSNLFTTPLATGVPFNWKDMTPVSMMALDQFVLWVNAETPTRRPASTSPPSRRPARARSRWAAPAPSRKTRSSPSASRRPPAPSSSTCPSRAAARWRCSWSASTSTRRSTTRSRRWRSGAPASCAPLCVFDDTRMPYKDKVTDTQSWADIPTCKEAGVPTDYVMLRGIFMAPGVTPGPGRLLRRPAEEGARDAGLEGVHGEGRLQHDRHDRRRVREVARRAPRRPHKQLMTEAGFLAEVAACRRTARRPAPAPQRTRQPSRGDPSTGATKRHSPSGRAGVATHVVDAVVARSCSCSASVVMFEARRLGAGWTSDGPGAGYFPFYIGLILVHLRRWASSYQAVLSKTRDTDTFVDREQLEARAVGAAAGGGLRAGRSCSSASTSPRRSTSPLFMIVLGKYPPVKSVVAGAWSSIAVLLPDVRGLVHGAAVQGHARPARFLGY